MSSKSYNAESAKRSRRVLSQLLSHLRLLNLRVGLLINFHVVVLKDGIHRLVNNYQEEDPLELVGDRN